jgi:hypothetical protein
VIRAAFAQIADLEGDYAKEGLGLECCDSVMRVKIDEPSSCRLKGVLIRVLSLFCN